MVLFHKKQEQDILEQKENKLGALNQRSEDALQLLRTTLNGLDAVDIEIDQTMAEIDEIQARMAKAREGLVERRNKNQRIKQNFKSLLCEE